MSRENETTVRSIFTESYLSTRTVPDLSYLSLYNESIILLLFFK